MLSIKKSLFLLLLATLLAFPTTAFAEGFGVYEWSANGVGMGEANMFGEEDPSVLAYNPAAITRFEGAYFQIGTTWISPANETQFCGGMSSNANWHNSYSPAWAPHMYYAQKSGKNSWWGVAVFPRFGNEIKYDVSWPGRYDTIFSAIQGMTVQPTYAWKMGGKWSAAVGLDINYIQLKMEKNTPSFPPELGLGDIHSELDGTEIDLGYVLSLMYDFTPDTTAAIIYHSKIKHSMDADMDFTGSAALGYPISTKARGAVTLPESITFGIGHKFNKGRTRIEFDAVWTNWATYDRLDMVFDRAIAVGPSRVALIPGSYSAKNWDAVWRFGAGIEHRLSNKWSVLCGYVFDGSPVPDDTMDFTVPTGDRHRGSIGFKYRPNDNITWSFAYCAIWAGSRNVLSHLPAPATGMDFTTAHLHDGLTQAVALSYTIKVH